MNAKRLCALLLTASVLAISAPIVAPTKTQASDLNSPIQVLKSTFSFIANHATAIATGATAGSVNGLSVKEYVLDPLAYMVQKVALQAITKSVVNWINGGFNGSPAFVTDINHSLLRVSDTYATAFLDELVSNSSIRSPFQNEIAQNIRSNYFLSTSNDGFFLKNAYTLNRVTPNDAAFLNGDFAKGGWDAWLETAQNPQDEAYGAQLLLQDELGNRVSNAIDNQKTEWQWSGGFNSFRGTDCGIKTNGAYVDVTNLGATAKQVALTTVNNCLFNAIQTSGSIISNAANQYFVNNGLNQYITADEVNEVVGALMGQLVNKVLGNGGLLGVSQPSSGGGRSYIDQASDPTQYTQSASAVSSSSSSANFLTTLGNQVSQLQLYQTNWQKINGEALSAQKALTACSQATSAADTVVTQSAAALANASSALTKLGQIQTAFVATVAGASNQTAAVNQAESDYQAFLAAATTPSASDLQFASDQSTDTGDATPASLYTQMTQLAATATCAAPH